MKLSQRVALVTGASRGIGRAIALRLASEGADLALVARSEGALSEVAQQVERMGRRVVVLPVDVTQSEAVKASVEKTVDKLGRLDILVNNAGVTKDSLLLRMTDQAWDDVLNVDLRGVFLFCRAAARPLLKSPAGRIIMISSVVGILGNAGQANYASAKAGLIGLTKSLAKEMGGRGVTVNCVCPGFIETDMTAGLPEEVRQRALRAIPAARIGKVEDIAEAIAFLSSDQASYITGVVLPVDGGMSLGSLG